MPPTVQQQAPEGMGLQHYLGIIRRRHLHFLIPMFIGWLAVWGASWVLPPRYKSGTLILVEQPTMPKDYVPPNVARTCKSGCKALLNRFSAVPVFCILSTS